MTRDATQCVDGRLMRHDPQPDDPYLQTDRGECPDCNGRGCEPPKVQHAYRGDTSYPSVAVVFDKRLTDAEMRDFETYVKEWEQ